MIALKLKLNLLSNFYSILDYSAPPTCRVNEQDDKEEVLNGSIPSAVADSRATSSVRTKKDRDRNAFITTG
jgi:hypothetical protein